MRRFAACGALVVCVALSATAATARPQTPPSIQRAAYAATIAAAVAKGTETVPGLGQVTGSLRNLVLLGFGFELLREGTLNLTRIGPPKNGRLQMSLANFDPKPARASLLLLLLSAAVPAKVKLVHFFFTLAAKEVKTIVKRCAAGSYPTTAFFDLGSPYVELRSWHPVSPNGWEIELKNLHPTDPVQPSFDLNCVSGLKVVYGAGEPTKIAGSVGGKPSFGDAESGPCPRGLRLAGGGFETQPGVQVTSLVPTGNKVRGGFSSFGGDFQYPKVYRVCVGFRF